MNSLLYAVVALLAAGSLQARSLEGVCVNARAEAVEYVNVSLRGCALGTISGADGTFCLPIPDSLSRDTVCFSHISYEEMWVPLAELERTDEVLKILLRERSVDLGTVSVTAASSKTVPLNPKGVRLPGMNVSGVFEYRGFANVGQMIDLKRKAWIRELAFDLTRNSFDTLVLRAVIYRVDGNAFTPLMYQPYYVYPEKSDDRQHFVCDLSQENIQAQGRVYGRIEPVRGVGAGEFVFPAFSGTRKWFVDLQRGVMHQFPVGIGLQLRGVELE